VRIRLGSLRPRDRARVAELLVSTAAFSRDEIDVALQLFDASVHDEGSAGADDAQAPDYEFTGAFDGERLLGYACAGPTPATEGTFDLYWLAVDPTVQGKGIGTTLVRAVERELRDRGARMLLVETSSRPDYSNTRAFYARCGYTEAARIKGDTGERLIGLLESRLDAIVYRAKFVATVFAARQFVSHGHILVNGKRVNIPSYHVQPGDKVEIKEKSKQLAVVLEANQLAERDVPEYVEVDHGKQLATYVRVPALGDVPYPVQMEPNLVVEFYSR